MSDSRSSTNSNSNSANGMATGDHALLTLNGERHASADSICSEVSSIAPNSLGGNSTRSTFQDTLLNSVNTLLGVGVLSLPYAFAKGGWLVAPLAILIALCAGYTAFALGIIQRDIIKVTPPLGVAASASGYYLRCIVSSDNGVRRYVRQLTEQCPILDAAVVDNVEHALAKDKKQSDESGRSSAVSGYERVTTVDLPSKEIRAEHSKGIWVITWLGKQDPRWLMEYEGPLTQEQTQPVVNDVEAGEGCKLLESKTKLVRVAFDEPPKADRLEQYPDIGHASFGKAGDVFLNGLFIGELYLFLVSMTILAVKSIEVVATDFTKLEVTVLFAAACVPQIMVRDFSKLTVLSFLGVFSCAIILVSLVYFGVSTSTDLPRGSGSLQNYSKDTDVFKFDNFSYAFSLVMGSFAGHSLFPSFRADMRRPVGYKRVIHLSFFICALYYLVVGVMGYMMYGNEVSDIVTLDFPQDKWETKAVSVCIAVVSYSKYGLASNCLCTSLEALAATHLKAPRSWFVYAPLRLGMTVLAAAGAMLIPGFGTVMAFLGAAVSCVISLVFPLAAYLRLLGARMSFGTWIMNCILLIICTYFCVTGTVNSLGFAL